MPTDRKKLYAISMLLTLLLLLLVVFAGSSSRWITAVLFIPATAAVLLSVKKRSVLSIHKKTVLGILTVIGVLYLMLLYLAGLYFGFEGATVPFSLFAVTRFILPITIIVVGSEIVRYILLCQKRRAVDICAYVMGVATELLIVGGIGTLTNFYAFMDYVGLALFPALFSNILYQHLSVRYGALPNIVYRLLTTLYVYVIPLLPAVPDVLVVFSRLVVPLLAFWFLSALFEKKRRYAARHRKATRMAKIFAVFGAVLALSLIMLVSGRFRYSAIVIASDSMNPNIAKGDVVIYERYDGGLILKGQILVFSDGESITVHRVIEIECVNGENRYYTKGDANEQPDVGYITDAQVIGITDFKIAYVGYPSLWIRQPFAG